MKRNLSDLKPIELIRKFALALLEELNPDEEDNGGSNEFTIGEVEAEMEKRMSVKPTMIIVRKRGLIQKTFMVTNPELFEQTYQDAVKEWIGEDYKMFLDADNNLMQHKVCDYVSGMELEFDVVDHDEMIVVS